MLLYIVFILYGVIETSVGIIYKLNSTEYEKLPPLFKLDGYDDCLDNSGIYYLATLELRGEQDNEIYNLIQEYSQHYTKHFDYTTIQRGVCITKTCDNYIIADNTTNNEKLILERCMRDELKQRYNLNVELRAITCERHKNEWDPIDKLDYAVGAIIAIICIAVALGSYYDLHGNVKNDESLEKGQKSLLCFSIFRNMRSLRQVNEDPNLRDWKYIDGIRVIIQVLVVIGHSSCYFARFIENPHDFEKSYDNPFPRLVYSSSSIIKMFFIISGFLMIYRLQIIEERHVLSWTKLLRMTFTRWWRFIPTLAILMGFMASWFRHIGSGPLWKHYVTNEMTSQCRTYFWAHIFLFNNYIPDDYICVLETWQLAADFQLFILALVVHLIIRKRSANFKVGTLALLFLIGMIGPALNIALKDLDAFFMIKPEFHRTFKDDTFIHYQQYAWNSIFCFFMGVANAYLAYYLKQKTIIFSSKLCNFITWLNVPALALVFYLGSTYYEDVERPSLTSRILFACCHQVALGFIAAYNGIGVLLKFNGFATHVLEWQGWTIPSRLSFCVYLIHYNVLHYLVNTRTGLITFSISNWMFVSFGVLLLSYALGLILHLTVESPTNQLVKIYLSDNKHYKKTA